jgi:hypothetical protein
MSITLADPFLKTTRAKKHLEDLRHELTVYYETNPCKLRAQDDLKNQLCRVKIVLTDTPDSIPLIVGDIFYNLRSALDQLVWCLAKLTLPYPRNTQFPMLGKEDETMFAKQTNGVPTEAAAIIKSFQPYKSGDAMKDHLLWRLNRLCNIDKHMRIPTHGNVVDFKLPASIFHEVHFEDNGVMSFPLGLKPDLKRHVTTNPEGAYKVVFGDYHLGIECDIDGIEEIYDFVADKVIPRFAGFFK